MEWCRRNCFTNLVIFRKRGRKKGSLKKVSNNIVINTVAIQDSLRLWTFKTEVTLINKLWSGEQESSQNRFRKFLRHAGQPTRKGIACRKQIIITYYRWNIYQWNNTRKVRSIQMKEQHKQQELKGVELTCAKRNRIY